MTVASSLASGVLYFGSSSGVAEFAGLEGFVGDEGAEEFHLRWTVDRRGVCKGRRLRGRRKAARDAATAALMVAVSGQVAAIAGMELGSRVARSSGVGR